MRIAVSSPLLETTISGASHVLVNISGDVSLIEANEAVDYVRQQADPNANIIFGTAYRETAEDTVTITVIATGVQETGKPGAKKTEKKKEGSARNLMDMINVSPAPTAEKPETEDIRFPDFSTQERPAKKEEPTIKIPDFLKKPNNR